MFGTFVFRQALIFKSFAGTFLWGIKVVLQKRYSAAPKGLFRVVMMTY